jgi:hypothetical protein
LQNFIILEELAAQVPSTPNALGSQLPLAEMAASGKSVLEELDLWGWWKPSSWLRWGLELTHFYMDIPWFGTIAICKCAFCVLPCAIHIFRDQHSVHNQHQEFVFVL